MKIRSFIASCVLASSLVALPGLAPAADYVTLQEPGEPPYQLGVGDKAPERYGRYENGMTTWKNKGLQPPNTGSQWVVIGDRFVRLRIGSALIEQIVEVPN